MTTTWHVHDDLLAAYVDGRLDAIVGASVEQHLGRCADCRVSTTPLVDPQLLARGWAGVRATVESPPLPLPVRLARRCGVPEPTAVLLAAATSLRTAWLVAAFLALSFATLATVVSGGMMLAPFLLVAPLVPAIGVAAAYGPQNDPLESLVVTAPYGRTRLILVRTLAVLVSVLPVTAALGLLLPGPAWLAAAWLGPALALVPVLLALSSFVGPRAGVAVVVLAWSALVVFSLRGFPATWPVEAPQQLAYLSLAVVAAAVLLVRSRLDRRIGAVL
ncbi:zf-HC2 domain-containing protein [Nocardioides sp. zg-1308]|uniref:zf-HC2 domain-containing protein n=1 Tax=Nocardioides sp. zg-1308 TaxID=2736253 RepID=UPI0015545C57|nr:zf-HC2 domain-containing protein [Nocardioides sp. zg-1308]NPD03783.1 zf-HC2 domain-containing protein [Nocardioides sp. zg-1308]